MQIRLGIGPIPLGDDDVALDAPRTRWGRRHFALGDAIGPVGKQLEHAATAEAVQAVAHAGTGLPRLYTAIPGCDELANVPSSFGISRIPLLPSAWHAVQPPDVNVRRHCAWLRMFGEMPLPASPVPGNSLLSGTFIKESQ